MDKITITGCPDLYSALDGLVEKLDASGLSNPGDNTPITIVLKTTGRLLPGEVIDNVLQPDSREFNAIAYVNGTSTQIINDLEGI
ncbi:MAG: hypothetical protein ABIP51_15240 [Bacteroidia bacterium]